MDSGELMKRCGRANERVNRRSEEVRNGSVFPHSFGKQSTNGKPNDCDQTDLVTKDKKLGLAKGLPSYSLESRGSTDKARLVDRLNIP